MIPWLHPARPELFPPSERALREPNGLLCAGGDLSPARLLAGYRRGIFPWYSEGEPLLWWCPDPRCVFDLQRSRVPRRLLQYARQQTLTVLWNAHFDTVIRHCAKARKPGDGTWITASMIAAYRELHALGHAFDLSVWHDQTLLGGIYGVGLGRAFFAESMFSTVSNGSKFALFALLGVLKASGLSWMDAQVASRHTLSLGAEEWPRARFLTELQSAHPELPFHIHPPTSNALVDWLGLLA